MSGTGRRKLSFLGFAPELDPTVEGVASSHDGGEVVHLDDEMEKVFQRDDPEELDPARLGEMGFDPERRRRSSAWSRRGRGLNSPSESDLSPMSLGSTATADPGLHDVTSTDSDTVLSDRGGLSDSTTDSPSDKKVQFDRTDGNTEAGEQVGDLPEDDHDARKKSRLHHHKGRKLSLQEEPRHRQRRVSIQPEDETLAEADLEDSDSHRSDDPRGLRRLKIHPKSSYSGSTGSAVNNDKNGKSGQTTPRKIDHKPHSVFVQLDELLSLDGGGEHEWKETARWIKYEEDVEEGSDRWGRPHVATLSFHSLLNLRRCLETGTVLLDLDEKDLPGVAYRIVEKMVEDELIEEDDKPVVMRSLLLRHRHVHEYDRGFRFSISGRKHSSYTSLQSLWMEEGANGGRYSISSVNSAFNKNGRRHSAQVSNLNMDRRRSTRGSTTFHLGSLAKNASQIKLPGDQAHKIDIKEETYTSSHEDIKKVHNDAILKRIPGGAEATTVLVGAVGFLDQPTIAFVRLANAIPMPGITEVPVPVRFMFILLGPTDVGLDYHEVGRSIATLMSNPTFHKVAYKADDRKELLSGINEFLDDSIVLPPGDWEQKALLPFDEIKAKSDMIKRRKREANERRKAVQDAAAAAKLPPIITMDEQKKALLEAEDLPKKEPVDPLKRTGIIFGGMYNDMKRRYPHYISDFRDALNGQCIAATIFMYFAALSSAITFGGLYADKSGYNTGISETLIFTSVGGILFALVSGQPMMITGATGPLLLFDESLYNFCVSSGFDFLVARMFMGFWIMIIALVVAAAEGSVLVKKFTRFTEDIFASLISLIFILEPITKLISVYKEHPLLESYGNESTLSPLLETVANSTDLLNGTSAAPSTIKELPIRNQPNTALFCTVLTLATFTIAYYLRIFRNGKFLGRSARRALGDFGVPIAIILMVIMDALVPQTYTEKLNVPEGVSPTNPERSWFVPASSTLSSLPIWAMFAMILPAMMVYIIVFMETHIAELIVDKPERNLKKGSGFHMDIVVMSLINLICGLFGAPWQCVATVRSVSHVSALTVMSTTHAPGEKPYIIEVKEQRVTGLLVSILCGLSVLMSQFLRLVPISVLFGVFLYMGISSINGIQLFDRIILLFKPVKHHPQVPYVRRVPTMRMHLFTFIQMACLAILWTVKSTKASLAFPFFLILMVPLRAQLSHIFTPMELRALDGKNQEVNDDEPDFYEEATLPG